MILTLWARVSALLPLMNLRLEMGDYPDEPLAYDGSDLHAIERLVAFPLSLGSMHCSVSNVAGLTR